MLRSVAALAAALSLAACLPPIVGGPVHELGPRPLVIAHRGASAERPEHTLAAYRRAIEAGADFIEPDLVITKDGVLVARHENEISGTTDVANRPEFAARRRTQTIDGMEVTGWFTEDFTLAELKTLRAKERLPQLRPHNAAFDGAEPIPTFAEVLAFAAEAGAARGRPVGVYPETKHPSHFAELGLALESALLADLKAAGLDRADAPVFIQSFETANLKALARRTPVRLIQLIAAEGGPPDQPGLTPEAMLSDKGLKAIARYADGVGVEKTLILPRDAEGRSAAPSDLVARAHAAGLLVHAWTFRPENYFLPAELRRGETADPRFPALRGDDQAELRRVFFLGVDGVFADDPGAAAAAREAAFPS